MQNFEARWAVQREGELREERVRIKRRLIDLAHADGSVNEQTVSF